MKKKQQKHEYLRGKVPQPKTTERLRTEKIEKKQHKLKYLKSKVPQPETERYCTEKKKTGMIRPIFIGDNTLTEVIK